MSRGSGHGHTEHAIGSECVPIAPHGSVQNQMTMMTGGGSAPSEPLGFVPIGPGACARPPTWPDLHSAQAGRLAA